MEASMRWTSKDLEALPFEDGTRYEIIDGELYVSRQLGLQHQLVCLRLGALLHQWSMQTGRGVANIAPSLIFAPDDDIAPDVVWISMERLPAVLQADGKLYSAPDLIVEVLSPGAQNTQRDREAKLGRYARRGVPRCWIIEWQGRRVEVYRQEQAELRLVATLGKEDSLRSPLLPDFSCPVRQLFAGLPVDPGDEGSAADAWPGSTDEDAIS